MAVQLFKDGQSIHVEINVMQSHLDSGWSFDDPDAGKVNHPEVIYPSSLKGIETLPIEEAEKIVLQEMGIEIVNPVSTPPVKRRGRPPKAK